MDKAAVMHTIQGVRTPYRTAAYRYLELLLDGICPSEHLKLQLLRTPNS